jgi:hypothetical protein
MAAAHMSHLRESPLKVTGPMNILPNRGRAETRKIPAEVNQMPASDLRRPSISDGTSRFSSSANAKVKMPMMSIIAPMSLPNDDEAASNRVGDGCKLEFADRKMLKMKGSRDTVKRRMVLSVIVVLVSTGRADMIRV